MKVQLSHIISIFLLVLALSQVGLGQSDINTHINKDSFSQLIKQLNQELGPTLSEDFVIINEHQNEFTGIRYIYFQQMKDGVEVYKSIGNIALSSTQSILNAKRIITDHALFEKQQTVVDATASVVAVAKHLDLRNYKNLGTPTKLKEGSFVFSELPISNGPTEVRKVWAKNNTGRYVLSWVINIAPANSKDHWEIVIDGKEGTVVQESNSTVYCNFDNHLHGDHDLEKIELPVVPLSSKSNYKSESIGAADGSQYRVYAVPAESPRVTERTLVSEPADEIASPFGWHDTDGIEGAEYNILRGNNVHAYQDTSNSNEPDNIETTASGTLIFDFPLDFEKQPKENIDADLTNLFYWNNYLHDWSYALGFTESAGNFQFNNYGKGGRDDDHVFAEALDGSGINNATFAAPRDGANGTMEMFKWILAGDFEILGPASVKGAYETGSAGFGPIPLESIMESIIYVRDNDGDSRDACDVITNGDELSGKIALIDRGTCDFSFKVHNAQEAGAIACIVCNNLSDAPLVSMSAGENSNLVMIPSVFLSREDCALIKSELSQGVTGKFNATRELSSGFDNGIVTHEYGHGISLRLTGGAQTSACLNNDEEMGEGWSDFFALVLTQQENDTGDLTRGIGTYVSGGPRDSRGIRRYPYSTDMSINPQLHSHIRFSARPHDVGEVWASALWDLYWAFIEQDGYDATWKDPTSGNVRALQLVMDGLKLQECDPSLLDGRDAILSADELLNLGENSCLIWSVFARRGFGVDAIANDPDSRYDNADGFEVPLSCGGEVTITKEMTPFIDPGNEIEVTLNVSNYKEALTEVVVTDEIPEGTTFLESSDSRISVEGNMVLFNIEDLPFGSTETLSYTLSTTDISYASFQVYDDMESVRQFETSESNAQLQGWRLSTTSSTSGIFSYRVRPDSIGGESFAQWTDPISVTAENHLLKFSHKYEMDLGIDGGVLEVSLDQGDSWSPISEEQYLVNGLPDAISNCFNNCPFPDFFYRNVQSAFTGLQGDWQTTIVDLSPYDGQQILVRFSYISLLFQETLEADGWVIDDFELYERKELNGQACITSGGTMIDCSSDFTLVNSNAGVVPVIEVITEDLSFSVSPNPADQFVNISLDAKKRSSGMLRIVSIDGRLIREKSVTISSGAQEWQEDISTLSSGMYFIELADREETYTVAFIKQ